MVRNEGTQLANRERVAEILMREKQEQHAMRKEEFLLVKKRGREPGQKGTQKRT